MAFHLDSAALEQREPRIAKWFVFGCHHVMTELDAGSASGDERRTVRQIVDMAEVAAKSDGAVVEQPRAVCFFHHFQFIEKPRQQRSVIRLAVAAKLKEHFAQTLAT